MNIKNEVRQFYNQVGWQLVDEDSYQNTRYEDLRPVSYEYIHRCHMRIIEHIKPVGRYMLDAGSGPIQYPEYLLYSRGFQYRVCADISIKALTEARKRIGDHGLFAVADIAALPFKPDIFDGIVSLHTIHHLPKEEHLQAYKELYRVLAPNCSAALVNAWPNSPLMNFFNPLIRLANRIRSLNKKMPSQNLPNRIENATSENGTSKNTQIESSHEPLPKGTFTARNNVAWLINEVGGRMAIEIWVWRCVSVRFLRALIHPRLGGRFWLRMIFWLEERFPHFLGCRGQYPLIIVRKQSEASRI